MSGGVQLSDLVSLHDVEHKALQILPGAVRGYYQSGADDEETLRLNREAFGNFLIRPFVLRDVSMLDTKVRISLCTPMHERAKPKEFTKIFKYPIGIAPTAFQRMANDEGEIGTVQAASETGTLMICSTLATVPLEEVARNSGPETSLFFQLYVYKDRALTERIVRRAECAGFSALVLTVDAPMFGRRRADERNAFQLPPHLKIANFDDATSSSTFQGDVGASGLSRYVISLFDASLNWDDLRWLVQFTKLPVLVKGLVRADDAIRAMEAGAAGIIVSNHGGRQLDHCVPSIEALPEVVKAVGGKIPVFVDGGFRTGTDVFKALALGADMVFIGRPIIYGLTVGGKEGVKHVLNLLRTELDYAMKLSGFGNYSQFLVEIGSIFRMCQHWPTSCCQGHCGAEESLL